MAKYFKSKRAMRYELIFKYLAVLVLSFVFIRVCIQYLHIISPVKYLNSTDVLTNYYDIIKENTINRPVFLLNYRADTIPKKEVSAPVVKMASPKKNIYIYNTHPTEKYIGGKNVVEAANDFKTILEKNNLAVKIEQGDITSFLVTNNYSYGKSYVASRYFIEEEINTGQYDLIIDFHRDALSKELSTAYINGKPYAKLLFVVGKRNANYEANYAVATELNNLIRNKNPDITRGIVVHSGNNVEGLYNQDLNANMILLEFGGHNNTYEEVLNTLEFLAPIMGEYLNDKKIQSI